MMKFKLISLFMFLCLINISAQTKNEKESKLQLSEYPQNAQTTINSVINDVKRIRHYKEIDGEHESFETKFKFEHHWYSVEFSNSGILEDIEVTIKKRELNTVSKNNINLYLKDHFQKYDFIKIQEQYPTDDSTEDADFLKSILLNREITNSNFEIVIAVKSSKDWALKEMTFNFKGEFLSSRDIQQDSYEYIMY